MSKDKIMFKIRTAKQRKQDLTIHKHFEKFMKPYHGCTFYDAFRAGYLVGKRYTIASKKGDK